MRRRSRSRASRTTSSAASQSDKVRFVVQTGGANYWFTETIGLAAELRYDDGFGTVGTRYAKQDLDTLGGSVKLLVRF